MSLAALLAATIIARAVGADDDPALSGSTLLKMEFIERFTRFVEWPAPLLADQQPLFILCTAGRGAVVQAMSRAAAYERIKGKPVAFRRVKPDDDLTRCHLIFIADGEERALDSYVAATSGRPILSVTDIVGGAGRGCLIGLYREGDRMAFEINRAASERSGLKVSSRLLRLARLVEPVKE